MGLFCALFFVLLKAPAAHAFSVNAEWVNAAEIKVNSISIDDSDRDKLSTEAGNFTTQQLNTWINDEAGNGKIYKYPKDLTYQKTGRGGIAGIAAEFHSDSICNATGGRFDIIHRDPNDIGIIDLGGGQLDEGKTGDFDFGRLPFHAEGDLVQDCNFLLKDNQDGFKFNFTLGKQERHNIWFQATSADTLKRLDADGFDAGTFTRGTEAANKNRFISDNHSTGCPGGLPPHVDVGGGDVTGDIVHATYETCDSKLGFFAVDIQGINDVKNNPGGSGGTTDTSPRCESGGLSWVVCPVINALADASDKMFDNIIKPFLATDSISTGQTDNGHPNYIYQAWSSVRIYGNILLIIGMLVIVFGQAIGGGLIDAYTAKKVAPRILAAAVGLNLSIYVVAVLVDITNLIGSSINTLLTGLVSSGGAHTVQLSLNGGATGTLAGGAAIAGAGIGVAAIVSKGGAIWALGSSFIQPLLLFVLLPLLLALVGVVVTIIIRKGLIMLLIITSPIAFALYCLPNTEQYFRKWWKLLFEALLIYPIVGVIFGVANLLAVTINQANTNNNGVVSAVAQILSLIVLVIPLFLVPYSFKLAGGVIGNLYNQISGYRQKAHQGILGNPNLESSRRNQAKANMGGQITRTRAQIVRATRGKGLLGRGVGNLANIGDVMSAEAAINAAGIQRGKQVKDTGDDTYGRALTSIPLFVGADGQRTTDASHIGADGRVVSHARATDEKSGLKLRTTLAGNKTVTDQDYKKAKHIYHTQGEKQYWMDYEATKINEGDTEKFRSNYLKWADQEHFSDKESKGVYTGVAFSEQNAYRSLKYQGLTTENGHSRFRDVDEAEMNYNADTGELGNNDNFLNDLYNKQGAYATGQLSAEDMEHFYKVKEHMTNQVQELYGKTGGDSHKEAQLKNAQERLAQIGSLEQGWAGSGSAGATMVPEEGAVGGAQPQFGGLSSGNQGIQDAFKRNAYRTADVGGKQVRVLDTVDSTTGQRVRYQGEGGAGPAAPPPSSSGGMDSRGYL